MEIRIIEEHPDGEGSVQRTVDFINTFEEWIGNAQTLWNRLKPDIKQAMSYEFSEANPNEWGPLKQRYREWKESEGYPSTIGILTGALKKSVTTEALVEVDRKGILWKLNPDIEGYEGQKTGEYAEDFHAKRPIFGFSKAFIKNALMNAVNKWIKDGKENAS